MAHPYPATLARVTSLVLLAAALSACQDGLGPASPRGPAAVAPNTRAVTVTDPGAPATVTTVSLGPHTFRFFPYTGDDFSTTLGTPGAHDPVTLLFYGQGDRADPRRLRAALRRLNGDRTAYGLPNTFPFNCTWSDALGSEQVVWGDREQWVGGAIQLACGLYLPMRFHMRLFRQDGFTVAGTHMDLQIPGTADHQVINWDLARQLVVVDFIRSGLLGGRPMPTGVITQTPTFENVPAVLYNGLPVPLRVALGGPPANISSPFAIPNDGRAMMLQVAETEPIVPDWVQQDLVITYGQAVPKPFCSTGPNDWIYIQGPLHLTLSAGINADGMYHASETVGGSLTITPVDPATGTPTGLPYQAEISEVHTRAVTTRGTSVFFVTTQRAVPGVGPYGGALYQLLQVGTGIASKSVTEENCQGAGS